MQDVPSTDVRHSGSGDCLPDRDDYLWSKDLTKTWRGFKKTHKKISQHPASPLERYLTIKLHLPLGISFSSLRYPETLARLSNRQWKAAETESFQGWTRAAICYWAIQSSKDKVEKKNISMFFHQTPRSPNACVLCQQLIQVTIRHSNQLDRQSPQALTVLSDNR